MWLSHFTEINHLWNWNVFSLNPKSFPLNRLGQLIPEVFQAENPHAADGYGPKQGLRTFPLQWSCRFTAGVCFALIYLHMLTLCVCVCRVTTSAQPDGPIHEQIYAVGTKTQSAAGATLTFTAVLDLALGCWISANQTGSIPSLRIFQNSRLTFRNGIQVRCCPYREKISKL